MGGAMEVPHIDFAMDCAVGNATTLPVQLHVYVHTYMSEECPCMHSLGHVCVHPLCYSYSLRVLVL